MLSFAHVWWDEDCQNDVAKLYAYALALYPKYLKLSQNTRFQHRRRQPSRGQGVRTRLPGHFPPTHRPSYHHTFPRPLLLCLEL